MDEPDQRSNGRISVLQLGNPTGMYGAERWILALVNHLDPEKVHSIVGVIKDDPDQGVPDLTSHADRCGLQTAVFDAPGRINLGAVSQIRKFILAEGVDILHTHGYKTDIIGLFATAGTPCKTISTPHGWSQNAGIVLQLYEILDRLTFLFLDRTVPLSEDLHAGLRKVPFLRRKLDLIRNGVDISEIEAERAGLVDASDRSNTRAFKVGYIGQLINRKRLDTLLRAFRDAAVENKELLIIGEGPQREQYEQLAAELDVADQVQFLGFRKDRIRFLLDFDVFAIASELEGIPRCIMEAMAAGIPVVASDIPGCRDIVEHDVNGLLFELGDHEELAEHFERLADTPQLGERLAAAASATVREQYSAQRMAEEYTDLFFEVAQRRQGAEGRVRSSGTSP